MFTTKLVSMVFTSLFTMKFTRIGRKPYRDKSCDNIMHNAKLLRAPNIRKLGHYWPVWAPYGMVVITITIIRFMTMDHVDQDERGCSGLLKSNQISHSQIKETCVF